MSFAGQRLEDSLPDLPASFAGHRRSQRQRHIPECFGDSPPLNSLLIPRKLVSFGGDQQTPYSQAINPGCQLKIEWRGRDAGINELNHQRHAFSAPEVLVNKVLPLAARGLSGRRVAVSREIDQAEGSIEPVKVYASCLARRGTCPGEVLLPRQPVYQAGFSNVRSSRQHDLGCALRREIDIRKSAHQEFSVHAIEPSPDPTDLRS
jgi:hypothetical protein